MTAPSFHGTEVSVEAGKSLVLEDTEGVLKDMDLETVEGPVEVRHSGNSLEITARGTEAGQAELAFSKSLPDGTPGKNFVYYSEDYQDVMTIGYYEPLRSTLRIRITPARCQAEIIKKELLTGRGLPGASLRVTDADGRVVDQWVSDGSPHRITGLTAGETYRLTELKAPAGYVTAEPVEFTARPGSQEVVMEDAATQVQILKTESGTGAPLPGAGLQLADSEGNIIEE